VCSEAVGEELLDSTSRLWCRALLGEGRSRTLRDRVRQRLGLVVGSALPNPRRGSAPQTRRRLREQRL